MPQIPGLIWDDEQKSKSASPNVPGLTWDDEAPKKPPEKKGFLQGVLDFPEEMYEGVNKAGKSAYEHIKQGQYPAAFHDITAPVWSPIEEMIKGTGRKLETGSFNPPMSPEQAQGAAKDQALGIVGIPTERFHEAWEASDYPRMAGQAVGAIGTGILAHKAGGMFGQHPEDLGPLPTVEEIKPKGLPPAPEPPPIDVKLLGSEKIGEPTPAPETVSPDGPEPVSQHEPIVRKNWNQAQIEYWKKRGYVSGGQDPETGYARMVYQGGTQPPPPAPSAPVQPPQEPMGDGSIPFHENDGFTVPGDQLTKSTVDGLKSQGYELVDVTPDGGGVFKRSEQGPSEMMRPPDEQMRPPPPPMGDLQRIPEPINTEVIGPELPPQHEIAPYRAQNQLENISQAQPEDQLDLGPQPDMSRFEAPSEMARPRVPSVVQRRDALKAQIDDAYRRGDTRAAVDLSQQLNEIDNPIQGAKDWRLGPNDELERAQGSSPYPRTRVADQGPQKDFALDTTREMMAARASQEERARALGIDPTNIQDDELSQRIALRRHELAGYEEDEPMYMQGDEPSNMEVMGTRRGGGLNNIAVGPRMDDTRLLRILGNSLYANDRPGTVVKELFQNSADERKISGIQEPIRIAFRYSTVNPETGDPAKSLIVQDQGRGLTADELYTKYTDVGTTGKGGEPDASGGFGMAKAAPLLGADFAKIESVVIDPDTGEKVRYSFEGNPDKLLNQKVGVSFKDELVEDPDVPTGLKVEVFFPDSADLTNANDLISGIIQGTPNMKNVEILKDFYGVDRHVDQFLKDGTNTGSSNRVSRPEGIDIPPLQHQLTTRGANVDIHFETDDMERKRGEIVYLNNGLYAFTQPVTYAQAPVPNVPAKIVLNVKATVEEGEPGYPFTTNREQMDRQLTTNINDWVKQNISEPAETQRVNELQKVFDDLVPAPGNAHVILDSGNRYTNPELLRLESSPHLSKVAEVMANMLVKLDQLFPVGSPFGQLGKTVKFGFQVSDLGKGGINIPSPKAPYTAREFAILVNVLAHMVEADTPMEAAERITHAILHEFNHNKERSEGGQFTWKFLLTDSKFGTENKLNAVKAISRAITGPDGDYAPGVRELISDYTAARGRPDTTVDTLARQRESEWLSEPEGSGGVPLRGESSGEDSASEMSSGGGNVPPPPRQTPPTPPSGMPSTPPRKKPGVLRELYNLTRGLTTTLDLSASMRQGLPLIGTKAFWTSWKQQIQALGSEGAFNKTLADLKARPIFQSRFDPRTGRVTKSWAEQAGMKLTDVGEDLTAREEATASNWAETGGMFGSDNPVQRGYKKTVGRAVRATNRAYTAYLNQLRADTFEGLLKDSKRIFDAGKTEGARDPYKDLVFAKEIADFVNTATGRGPLKTAVPVIEGGRVRLAEPSFEQHAKILSDTLFSPRLFASRVRMLNPATYMMASPFVRKQYIKAILGVAGAWGTFAALGKMAGADVSTDPNSADFGKIKIGNTRIDPAGGFQQYLVAASRLITGHTTSSNTGQDFELGQGYRPDTRKDIAERFMTNKLHPVVKFGYDLLNASEHQPFSVGDRTAQLFVPLIIGDTMELIREDPTLLPLLAPVIAGMGTQTYEKGSTENKFIPKDYDWSATGGELPNLWDDNQ